MKSLSEIYQNCSVPDADGHGDKGTVHTYIDEYSRLLEPYRRHCTFLEIGVAYGESLKMWNEYFIDSTIVGVDISSAQCGGLLDDPQYNIIIADATKPSLLEKISQYTFDVVIDDGEHQWLQSKASFEILKSKMSKGGLYVIEDIPPPPRRGFSDPRDVSTQLNHPVECVEFIDNTHIKGRDDDFLLLLKF